MLFCSTYINLVQHINVNLVKHINVIFSLNLLVNFVV